MWIRGTKIAHRLIYIEQKPYIGNSWPRRFHFDFCELPRMELLAFPKLGKKLRSLSCVVPPVDFYLNTGRLASSGPD